SQGIVVELAQLHRAPWLPRLTHLSLRSNDTLTHRGLAALFQTPTPHLLELDLTHNRLLGPGCGHILGHTAHTPALRMLNLSSTQLGADELQALLSSPNVTHLNTLLLSNNPLGPSGAQLLLGQTQLATLTHLNLSGCSLGPAGARTLARIRHWPRLDTLSLESNGIDLEGLHALLQAPWLRHLSYLALAGNAFGKQGALALTRSARLDNLMGMTFFGRGIDQSTADRVAQAPNLRRLEASDARLRALPAGPSGHY
ncbi:MAG: hypothetical protein AAFS10_24465, partial [Myxococcota bacterium]